MIFTNTLDLSQYRIQLNKEFGTPEGFEGTPITLYGVYTNIMYGVIEFNRITKKHLYSVCSTKHSYPSRSAGLTVFTSASEAWRFYKSLVLKKQNEIETAHKIDMEYLEKAFIILRECSLNNPEYTI